MLHTLFKNIIDYTINNGQNKKNSEEEYKNIIIKNNNTESVHNTNGLPSSNEECSDESEEQHIKTDINVKKIDLLYNKSPRKQHSLILNPHMTHIKYELGKLYIDQQSLYDFAKPPPSITHHGNNHGSKTESNNESSYFGFLFPSGSNEIEKVQIIYSEKYDMSLVFVLTNTSGSSMCFFVPSYTTKDITTYYNGLITPSNSLSHQQSTKGEYDIQTTNEPFINMPFYEIDADIFDAFLVYNGFCLGNINTTQTTTTTTTTTNTNSATINMTSTTNDTLIQNAESDTRNEFNNKMSQTQSKMTDVNINQNDTHVTDSKKVTDIFNMFYTKKHTKGMKRKIPVKMDIQCKFITPKKIANYVSHIAWLIKLKHMEYLKLLERNKETLIKRTSDLHYLINLVYHINKHRGYITKKKYNSESESHSISDSDSDSTSVSESNDESSSSSEIGDTSKKNIDVEPSHNIRHDEFNKEYSKMEIDYTFFDTETSKEIIRNIIFLITKSSHEILVPSSSSSYNNTHHDDIHSLSKNKTQEVDSSHYSDLSPKIIDPEHRLKITLNTNKSQKLAFIKSVYTNIMHSSVKSRIVIDTKEYQKYISPQQDYTVYTFKKSKKANKSISCTIDQMNGKDFLLNQIKKRVYFWDV